MKRNKLTPAEEERLYNLAEEMGEVLQWVGKIGRHGYDNSHPKYGSLTTRANFSIEVGDLLAIIDLLIENEDVNQEVVRQAREEKIERLKKYLYEQEG